MPAAQIKQDINRSGWESTDFPSSCESCLPANPYVQMLKEDHGAECKICTRPFTVFRWKADRTSRTKRTNICLTCARLKNCCQCCMLDLSFGLPLSVRDAALKMVAPGPNSEINREYYAQEHEKEIEEGRGGLEAYEKTDEKARELLRRLANSQPYYKRQRQLEAAGQPESSEKQIQKQIGYGPSSSTASTVVGPVRTSDAKKIAMTKKPPRPVAGARPPQPEDYLPPSDPNILSLFVTGVEDDLPEHAIRTFFSQFGQLRSLVCSHRSHCAFVNFGTRDAAETAAMHCRGRAVIQGCPLRVRWGKPRPLDSTDREQRMEWAKEGRQTAAGAAEVDARSNLVAGGDATSQDGPEDSNDFVVAPPPGQGPVNYASLQGD